jgi:hypothetical protein
MGLFFIPKMIYMGVESHGGMILTGKQKNSEENLSQCHFVKHKLNITIVIPTRSDS